MNRKKIKDQIEILRKKLTGDMFKDMETRNQIHRLEMVLNGVKPTDSQIDCFGCGS